MSLLLLLRGQARDIQAPVLSSVLLQASAPPVAQLQSQVLSSVTVQGALSSLTYLAAGVGSSVSLDASIIETERLGAALLSSFSLGANAQPEVFPSVGAVRSTAAFLTQIGYSVYLSNNSSSPDLHKVLDVTTERQALGVASFGNARRVSILPASTNATPLMLSCGLSATGVKLSSRGPTDLAISERFGSELYLYTTSGTAQGVRVDIR